MNTGATFAGRLRAALSNAEMTQEELARRMGVSPAAVSRWAHGHRTPLSGYIARMADTLGVSVDWLLTGREA